MGLSANIFRFGDFTLDTDQKVLLENGKPVSITPKALQLLSVLVECHGRIVEKEILISAVWPDSFVEESNLTFNISQLRKILGDTKDNSIFIETVARRGYRFVAEVSEDSDTFLAADQDRKTVIESHAPRPYVLITISAVLLFTLFGLALVWFRGEVPNSSIQTANRLTNSGKVTIAAISTDGRKLVYAQKEGAGESLWQREIATGKQTQILPSEAAEFVGLAVSPTSDFAYYSVFKKNAVASAFSRISLNGGEAEPLPEIASDVSVSFSPDGKEFAYTESHSAVRETLLKTANADGSESKTLLTLQGEKRGVPVFRASPVAWSPDGEIACAVQETEENTAFFRILLVNPDDRSEKYLSDRRWNYVESIVWKDSETLAITNLEPNSAGREIWLISRKTGEVRKKSSDDLKKYEWLSAANGELFAVARSTYSSLCISDFPEDLKKAQTKQIFNEAGEIEYIDWSKDDKIFYNSWASGKNEIWQIDPHGTNLKQLTSNSNLTLGFTVSPVDGTLVFTATQKRADSLFIAEPDGKNIRQLTYGIYDSLPHFMPDGKEVVFQQGSINKPTIWRVSIAKDQPPEQLTGYRAQQPSVSPDGKTIAYQFMDLVSGNRIWKLGLMDSSNGTLLNKIDFPLLITKRNVVWRPGDNLLTMTIKIGENSGFLLLSTADNSYQTIENVTNDKIASFVWSPDGKRLAFAANQEVSDAVILDEF